MLCAGRTDRRKREGNRSAQPSRQRPPQSTVELTDSSRADAIGTHYKIAHFHTRTYTHTHNIHTHTHTHTHTRTYTNTVEERWKGRAKAQVSSFIQAIPGRCRVRRARRARRGEWKTPLSLEDRRRERDEREREKESDLKEKGKVSGRKFLSLFLSLFRRAIFADSSARHMAAHASARPAPCLNRDEKEGVRGAWLMIMKEVRFFW